MIVKFKKSPNWYVRFRLDGLMYQKSLKTSNKRQAEKLAGKYKQDVINGIYDLDHKKITIRECFELYGKSKSINQGVSNSVKFYTDWLNKHVIDVDKPLTEITTVVLNQIVRVRRDEGKKPATVRHAIGFVTRALNYSKKLGYQVSNVDKPDVRVKNKKLIWFTLDDERRILSELSLNHDGKELSSHCRLQDNIDFFMLLIDTGFRLQELANLKWTDVNLDIAEIQLYRPKVNNQSVIHMTKRVFAILKRRCETQKSQWVFSDTKNIGPKKSFGAIRSAIKRAGFEQGTLHICRHSYASRLIQAGVPLYDVSQILGHTSLSMTTRYAHLNKSHITKNAASVLDSIFS